METLVIIDCCMREDSRTRRLLSAAAEVLSERYEVSRIDVNALGFKPLTPKDLELRSQGYVPEEVVAVSRQVAAADRIVIAAPFWDMSFPAALKAFFENVSLFHITFDDNGRECCGLCRCRRVLYLTTRGMNIRTGDLLEQGSPYIRALSGLWGLGEVVTVAACNLDYLSQAEVDRQVGEAAAEAVRICREF